MRCCNLHRPLLFLLLAFAFTLGVEAKSISGICVGVTDGDTATVQTADEDKVTVRFQGIDAPESSQKYGQESKEKLKSLILGKKVRVVVIGKDHYKRTLGHVYVGKLHINAEMVRSGLAWHYVQYAPDDTELSKAQRKARAARNGLWKDRNPLPPWQWRKNKRSTSDGTQAQRSTPAEGRYWVSKAGKIHNKSCEAYGISPSGTYTNNPQGINCKACGGTGR